MDTLQQSPARKILLLQTRNLGDCVIGTSLVETLNSSLPARIDILTRPEMRSIFAGNPGVSEIHTARFPMGSVEDFHLEQAKQLPGLILRLRRERYTDVANFVGDFREELLARLISSGRSWSPLWPAGHPGGEICRQSRVPLSNRPIPIVSERPSIYDAVRTIGMAMGASIGKSSALYEPSGKQITWDPSSRVIAIHPMASQASRRWPLENWVEIARILCQQGAQVRILASPSEMEEVRKAFASVQRQGLELRSGNLHSFFNELAQSALLLCQDSFAAHAAHAIGVPIIFLNGSNEAATWAPPGSVVLMNGPAMSCYPCYNRPGCINTDSEYACIRGIRIEEVLRAVNTKLNRAIVT